MIAERRAILDLEVLRDKDDLLEEYGEVLEGLLSDYFTIGAPTIYGLVIEDYEFDETSNEGAFSVEFSVSYYFGCDDYNRDDEESGHISFSIDLENSEVVFTGWDEVERDPDEY